VLPTATALGVTIPASVLVRGDEVIAGGAGNSSSYPAWPPRALVRFNEVIE